MIDRYKHEAVGERVQRHQEDVRASRGSRRKPPFDVRVWDRMHREAEDATIFKHPPKDRHP